MRNYRVVRFTDHTDDGLKYEWLEIKEVHFGSDGKPTGWFDPFPHGSTLSQLADDVARMSAALGMPIVDENDFVNPFDLSDMFDQDED